MRWEEEKERWVGELFIVVVVVVVVVGGGGGGGDGVECVERVCFKK